MRARPSILAALALAAVAGLARAAGAPEPVRVFDAAAVRAAFAKGQPLVETAGFKVHASRRDAPGVGEVHVRDTDVLYLLEGSATFVTGGALVDPKEVAPGELRGRAIEGGDEHALAAGEVVIVPSGTPHWFRDVKGPLVYYVVKVTDAGGAR